MAGIPTSNILQPGAISLQYGTQGLIAGAQLLTPQYYKTYVQKYGDENFTWWLSTYAGMEEVFNQTYFWFENNGKLMLAIANNAQVSAAAGATITVQQSGGYYNGGTQSPIRVGETLRVASSNVEGVVLAITSTTANAFQFTVRPKIATQAFATQGQTYLAAGEVLIMAGNMDVGEASSAVYPQIHLDIKYQNTITELSESWSASDLAEMTQVFYENGVTGDAPVGQAGSSYFTLKGLWKANQRYMNNCEFKLFRGDVQNNTGLSNSVGAQGFISQVAARGETVAYSAPNLDLQFLHTLTRIMDVNGCVTQNLWLQDIFQNQQFSDGIFKEFPAGAFVWGQGEKSQEASVSFGFREIYIDGYLFQTKKYRQFNTEYTTGLTPAVDYFRSFGVICPMGETSDAKDASKKYKNLTMMYQMPPKGGTIGNGVRVWQYGGGSEKATDGTMTDNVRFIAYRSLRAVAANQFILVQPTTPQ
jgi:hypothetical protein